MEGDELSTHHQNDHNWTMFDSEPFHVIQKHQIVLSFPFSVTQMLYERQQAFQPFNWFRSSKVDENLPAGTENVVSQVIDARLSPCF